MIRRIEALRYRSLLHVDQPLGEFQLLVGPNASGKSTFLDVVELIGEVAVGQVESALLDRAPDWRDLTWRRRASSFQLALEADVPERFRDALVDPRFARCRYEVEIGELESGGAGILEEAFLLKRPSDTSPPQRDLFPEASEPPETILTSVRRQDVKTIVHKRPEGNDNFYEETGEEWHHTFQLGHRRSALANVPEDETKFPVATWFKSTIGGEAILRLDSRAMRQPSPPGAATGLRPDGSNLAWVLRDLEDQRAADYEAWLESVRQFIPELRDVRTVVRDEDRHCYIKIETEEGDDRPSWALSDGTVKMLALTVLPKHAGAGGPLLLEEPENGLHPGAVRAVYGELSGPNPRQIVAATHSPVLLRCASPEEVLCVSSDSRGATDLVRGENHPDLQEWRDELRSGESLTPSVLD